MKTKWTDSELKAMSREEIDKLYEIVTWYEGLRETNNETFLPLFADTHRYLVLKAAAVRASPSSRDGRCWSGRSTSRDTASSCAVR